MMGILCEGHWTPKMSSSPQAHSLVPMSTHVMMIYWVWIRDNQFCAVGLDPKDLEGMKLFSSFYVRPKQLYYVVKWLQWP